MSLQPHRFLRRAQDMRHVPEAGSAAARGGEVGAASPDLSCRPSSDLVYLQLLSLSSLLLLKCASNPLYPIPSI